jgi:hypothetical protein
VVAATRKAVGNERFRDAVVASLPAYQEAATKRDKGMVAQALMDEIRKLGGRFLKSDDQSPGMWRELDESQTRDKVCRALRDASRKAPDRQERPKRHKADERRNRDQEPDWSDLNADHVGEVSDGIDPEAGPLEVTSQVENFSRTSVSVAAVAELSPRLSSSQSSNPCDLNNDASQFTPVLDSPGADTFLDTIDSALGPLSPEGSDPFQKFLENFEK